MLSLAATGFLILSCIKPSFQKGAKSCYKMSQLRQPYFKVG